MFKASTIVNKHHNQLFEYSSYVKNVQHGAEQVRKKTVRGTLTFDRDNELGDDGKDLGLAIFEHVVDALHGKEAVRVGHLTDAFEEDGQVVMVVKLVHLNFPCNLLWRAVLDLNGQISAVVESAELGRLNGSPLDSASQGLLDFRLFLFLV